MKNLFLLPTDKPSRLVKFFTNKFHLCKEILPIQDEEQYQNIYLTSDDEIKEGEWKIVKYKGQSPQVVKSEYANSVNNLYTLEYQAKIILTTDQDLIKDGVQAIDDTFIEWFVKNPSCEEVGIEPDYDEVRGDYYKIILPKEEPDYTALLKPVGTTQETLEEAAENYSKITLNKDGLMSNKQINGFIAGAKWQAERMYSEKEAYKIWKAGQDYWKTSGESKTFEEFVEQFKKKA